MGSDYHSAMPLDSPFRRAARTAVVATLAGLAPLAAPSRAAIASPQELKPADPDAPAKSDAPRPNDRENRVTPVVQVVRKVGAAVVHIRTEVPIQRSDVFGWGLPQTGVSTGSGVLVDPDGYVVTNEHVIRGAQKIEVFLAGDDGTHPYPGELVNADFDHDLALVKITRAERFPSVVIGRSDDLMIGETVIAIGNPTGMLADSVTTGVLSAVSRELEIDKRKFRGLLQTDAAINPGNSGGPLLNANGELIGINFSIVRMGQNLGFAIPADQVRVALDERLMNVDRTRRFWLGMRVQETPEGVRVKSVDPGGPAVKAGVRAGDLVAELAGRPVGTALEYSKAALQFNAGDELRLKLKRGRSDEDVSLRLLSYDDRILWERLGIVAREVQVKAGRNRETRLVIDAVDKSGPAAEIKLREQDVLWSFAATAPVQTIFGTRLERRAIPIDSKETLRQAVEQLALSRSARELQITVQREGRGYEGELPIR